MKITRIDFEGKAGRYATVQRKEDDQTTVTLLVPEVPGGYDQIFKTGTIGEIMLLAEILFRVLENRECEGRDRDGYMTPLKQMFGK